MVKAISTTGVLVVKMKDVAELAGVSSAAVSRYLNGGYISADKAARIKQAIELTGYVRSSQARALRTGSTKLIGVIVPKINSESVSRITAGIGQVLGRRGYQMLLANTDNAADRELEYLDLFQNHPVDGIVLVATMITDEHRRNKRLRDKVVNQCTNTNTDEDVRSNLFYGGDNLILCVFQAVGKA